MPQVTLDHKALNRLVRVARDGVYTEQGVCQRYQFNRDELRRLRAAGLFPGPILIGKHERWPERLLREYEDRLAGRDEA